MISHLAAFALSATVCVAEPAHAPAVGAKADSTFAALFDKGVPFNEFMAKAERRKEQWVKNYAEAVVPDALVARARAVPGPWKLLIVAVDGCSDSVNTVPYVARLVEKLIGVEIRIINSEVGKAVMEGHKTPDGRGATPTIVLLDDTFAERGCWIERPVELQSWIGEQKGKMNTEAIFSRKMSWYDSDKGQKTLAEVVEVLEAAGRGTTRCRV